MKRYVINVTRKVTLLKFAGLKIILYRENDYYPVLTNNAVINVLINGCGLSELVNSYISDIFIRKLLISYNWRFVRQTRIFLH